MAEHDGQHRGVGEESKNVWELNEWRRTKADPMLDNHQKILIDGDGGKPSLLLSQGLLHGKFDTLIQIGKTIIALITIFGTLIGIFEIGGPWIREKLGLPVTISVPAQQKPGVQSKPDKPADANINDSGYVSH